MVRDVLDADLRWRDPERYAEMYRRKLTAFHDRVRATADEHEQLELVARMVVLNGARSPLAALSALPPPMRAYADGLRESDRKPVVAMTATWQGTKQAELVAYWMRHRPEAFRTFRTAEGSCAATPRRDQRMTWVALLVLAAVTLVGIPLGKNAWRLAVASNFPVRIFRGGWSRFLTGYA